jgi:P27 family predicted phage terminase small subunit
MPGPAPKPTSLRIAQGNPGRKPISENEPKPPVDNTLPDPPEYLDDYAKEVWKIVGPALHKISVLTSVDYNAFMIYCQTVSDYKWALETVKTEGRVITTGQNGYMQPHPAIAIGNKAADRLKSYAREFGLTPSARVHLQVMAAESESDLEKQLFG